MSAAARAPRGRRNIDVCVLPEAEKNIMIILEITIYIPLQKDDRTATATSTVAVRPSYAIPKVTARPPYDI